MSPKVKSATTLMNLNPFVVCLPKADFFLIQMIAMIGVGEYKAKRAY